MERVKAEQIATSAAEDLVDIIWIQLKYTFPEGEVYDEFVKKVEEALTPILKEVPA